MIKPKKDYLELISTEVAGNTDGVDEIILHTNQGSIQTRYHASPSDKCPAVVWVGGSGGGLDGPARGMYNRLARQLAPLNISSLRLHYRFPNNLPFCVLDTLLGVAYLQSRSHTQIALVGHSFGGAVVISAGAASEYVTGVAALSSQTLGTEQVKQLSPRPLLLLHGSDDEILPDSCSRNIFARAREPKEIKLYPGCKHGLDQCQDQVDLDLRLWLEFILLGGQDQ